MRWRLHLPGLLELFRRDKAPPVDPWVPDGRRVYAIGDVHGQAHLLREIHRKILTDAAGYEGKIVVLYLGDYIDRGEQSRQVIELLLEDPLSEFDSIYLLGNHEQALLDFLEDPLQTAAWLAVGGRETLMSYGVPIAHIPNRQELPELSRQLSLNLPDAHRAFMQSCDLSWQCGSYYFAHAGIRPGVPLYRQRKEDLLWIRDGFLSSNRNHEAIIVHGHSVYDEPQFMPNRISIDTGAYDSGVLTCLVLEGAGQRLLQTGKKDESFS